MGVTGMVRTNRWRRSLVLAAVVATLTWGTAARVVASAEPELPAFATPASEPGEASSLFALSLEDLSRVTVTASRRIQSIADAPATVYVITEQDIERFGFVDLKDVLKIVPGIIVEDASYGQLYGGQRGFTGVFQKTLIMVNGRELNNILAGEAFIGPQFPLHAVKRIEIVVGPGSALYGANAFAGVINIITRSAEDPGAHRLEFTHGSGTSNLASASFAHQWDRAELSVTARFKTAGGADFGSEVSDLARFNGAVFRGSNGWSRLPDGRYYNATTGQVFRTPSTHGDRFENPEDARFLDLSYTRRLSGGGVTPDEIYLGADYYDMTTGHGVSKTQQLYVAGEDHRELLMTWIGARKRFWDERMELRAEFRFTRERTWGNHTAIDRVNAYPDTLGMGGGGNVYGYPPVDDDSNTATPYTPGLGQVERMRGYWSNKSGPGSRRYYGEVQVAWNGDFLGTPVLERLPGFGARTHHAILGYVVDRKEATTNPWSLAWPSGSWNSVFFAQHPPLSAYDRRPALSATKHGVYVQDQVAFLDGRVQATAGVRYDHHENDGGDYYSYGGIFNPRAGLVIHLTPRDTLKILYGKAFREATPFEDPGLRPERMTTYELGWIHRLEQHGFENQVNLYFNRATNYILNEPQRFPDGRIAYGYTNGGQVEVYGLEEVLHWEPSDRLAFDAVYTWQDPWIRQRVGTNPGNPVERFRLHPVPRHSGNVRAYCQATRRLGIGTVARWSAAVKNFDDPSQYGANANPIARIPAWIVADLNVRFRLGRIDPLEDEGWTLSAGVRNLFDRKYEHSNNRYTSAFMENPTVFPQEGRSWLVKLEVVF